MARIVGTSIAKELIFTARKISGQQALDYKIVNYVENKTAFGQ